jgi:small conductance mechanosensitive channel
MTVKDWLINLGSEASLRLLAFALILIVGIIVIQIILAILGKALKKTKMEKAAHTLIRSVTRILLYLLLGLAAASSLGIDVTGIVALASVFTLALSLSLQNSLTNLIGGFTLLSTKPFKSGDYVEIAGQAGSVTEIGMFYTVLTTPDNKITHIPNNSVVSADITNYTTTGTRRLSIDVSASYDAPTEKVLEALRDAANVPGILEDPAPFVALTGYGDHAITYTVRVWTKTEDYWTVHYAIHERIRECFAAHGVAMTHPHLNVHLDK